MWTIADADIAKMLGLEHVFCRGVLAPGATGLFPDALTCPLAARLQEGDPNGGTNFVDQGNVLHGKTIKVKNRYLLYRKESTLLVP